MSKKPGVVLFYRKKKKEPRRIDEALNKRKHKVLVPFNLLIKDKSIPGMATTDSKKPFRFKWRLYVSLKS